MKIYQHSQFKNWRVHAFKTPRDSYICANDINHIIHDQPIQNFYKNLPLETRLVSNATLPNVSDKPLVFINQQGFNIFFKNSKLTLEEDRAFEAWILVKVFPAVSDQTPESPPQSQPPQKETAISQTSIKDETPTDSQNLKTDSQDFNVYSRLDKLDAAVQELSEKYEQTISELHRLHLFNFGKIESLEDEYLQTAENLISQNIKTSVDIDAIADALQQYHTDTRRIDSRLETIESLIEKFATAESLVEENKHLKDRIANIETNTLEFLSFYKRFISTFGGANDSGCESK